MSAAGERAARDAERTLRLTLLASCLAFFVIQLDVTIVNIALPSIQADLETSTTTLEWTINAYLLAFGGLLLLGGKLGDRFGRRRLFVVGLLVFAAASLGCALAASAGQLIAARAAQGFGAALLTPLSLALITAASPTERLPAATGIWGAVAGLGMASGPLVGGLLVESAGWSAVFWVNLPIAAIVALIALRVIEESRGSGALMPGLVPGACAVRRLPRRCESSA